MLRDKLFFKFALSASKFFGLMPKDLSKLQKFRALLLFSVLNLFNHSLVVIELATTENPETIMKGFRTIAGVLMALTNIAIFVRKSNEIEELFDDLNDTVQEEQEEKEIFEVYYRESVRTVLVLGAIDTLGVFMNGLMFLVTGQSEFPGYIIRDHGVVFFFTWFMQTTFIVYSTLMTWVLESNLYVKLNILVGYSKVLGKKFKNIELDRRGFKKVCEAHLKFKK